MASYYVTIKGKRYDRALYEQALDAVVGQGDGRIGRSDADKLLRKVIDQVPGHADAYTDVEKATVKLLRENFKWTDAADHHFRSTVRKVAALRVHEARQPGGGTGVRGSAIAAADLRRALGDNPIGQVTSGYTFKLPAAAVSGQAPAADLVKAALGELNRATDAAYDASTIALRFDQRLSGTDSVPDLIVEEGLLVAGPYGNPQRRQFADGFARYVDGLLTGGGDLFYTYYRDQRGDRARDHAVFVVTRPGSNNATLLQVDVGA